MTWNYQIVKDKHGYSIREVINERKKPVSWTVDEVSPSGDTRDELRKCITMYINDITSRPILIIEGGKVIGKEPPLTELLHEETND